MLKNTIQSDRPQMIIWRMRIACWITKATNTNSQVALVAFLLQNGCKNAHQCYVIRKLPVLFNHQLELQWPTK